MSRKFPENVVSLRGFKQKRARQAATAKRHEAELRELAAGAKLFEAVGQLIDLSVELLERGNFRGAEHALRTVLTIEKDNPHALYNLGVVFEDEGRAEEAVDRYEQALESSPNFADAHFNLGRLLEQRGDKLGALKHRTAHRRLTRNSE